MKKLFKVSLFVFLAVLTVALSVNASGKIEAYLDFYGENKAYCDDIRNKIPLNKSEKAKESLSALIGKLTTYAVSYYGENAFSETPEILSDIENAEKSCKDTIETQIYLCNESIRENRIKKEYVEKGYIVLSEGKGVNTFYEGRGYFAETDEEKIREENEKLLRERINGIKNGNVDYALLNQYVTSVKNTEYAVYDGKGNILTSNSEERTSEEAKEYFKSKKDYIIIGKENKDSYALCSDSFTFLISSGYDFPKTEEDYCLYIATDESLGFDSSMSEAEEFYGSMEKRLSEHTDKMKSALMLPMAVILLTLLVSLFLSCPKNKKIAFVSVLCFLAVTALSVSAVTVSANGVIENLATSSFVLSASLSKKLITFFLPLVFLSAEGFLSSVVLFLKAEK